MDPKALFGLASGAAQFWLRTTIKTQQQILELLAEQPGEQSPAREQPTPPPTPQSDSLNSKMQDLLDRALDQSTKGSQAELFHHILDQLVADEARIIGALSDGSTTPALNVYDWTRRRTLGRAVLENAALIGRNANVALNDMVPTYISHLLTLGLVQTGPEDPDLKDEYEILMAEPAILKSIERASRGPLPAKIEKFTLTLSPLGRAFWAATMQRD